MVTRQILNLHRFTLLRNRNPAISRRLNPCGQGLRLIKIAMHQEDVLKVVSNMPDPFKQLVLIGMGTEAVDDRNLGTPNEGFTKNVDLVGAINQLLTERAFRLKTNN